MHLKDINEETTKPAIGEIRGGAKGDIVMSETQEPEKFKKIMDTPWGKGVTKIGNEFNKKVDSVISPEPQTETKRRRIKKPEIIEKDPHLEFKLSDKQSEDTQQSG